MCFRNYNHEIYTVTSDKTETRNPNENDKELKDGDKITANPHGSNLLFIKYFHDKDKDIPSSNDKLKLLCPEFTKNN